MIHHRYAVIALGIAMMAALYGYVASGRMGLEMFPKSESDYAYCEATLPYGSSKSKLTAVEKELIQSARTVIDKNGGENLSAGVLSSVSDNVIEVRIYLTDMDKRPLSTTQVRYAFQGAKALQQQRGRNEVTVRVSLPQSERSTEFTLENLVLRSDTGEIYLRDAAKLIPGRAYTEIERINGRRTIEVTANVTPQARRKTSSKRSEPRSTPSLRKNTRALTCGLGGIRKICARP